MAVCRYVLRCEVVLACNILFLVHSFGAFIGWLERTVATALVLLKREGLLLIRIATLLTSAVLDVARVLVMLHTDVVHLFQRKQV